MSHPCRRQRDGKGGRTSDGQTHRRRRAASSYRVSSARLCSGRATSWPTLSATTTLLYVNLTGKFVIAARTATRASRGARSSSTPTAAGCPRRRSLLGQDASKVDRSAAYAARHIAKNMVAGHRRPDTRPTLLRDRHRTSAQHLCGYLRHGAYRTPMPR